MDIGKKDSANYSKEKLTQIVEEFSLEIFDLMKEKDKLEGEVKQYKAAFEAEQDIRKAAEIRAEKYEQAWGKLIEILDDNDVLGRIKGWYWHTQKEQPVYVDDISVDGMTGYALNLGSDGRFLGSVTDTFKYDHLIRIDRNLDNPF